MERERLRRLCADCGEKYYPTGKYTKYCWKCLDKRMKGASRGRYYKGWKKKKEE